MRVAVAQLCSREDVGLNLATCRRLALEARSYGAELVAFPEMAPLLGRESERLARAEGLGGAVATWFGALASELGLGVLLGSMAEAGPDPSRTWNTSVLFGSDGAQVAVYRKIHLFDVEVDNGPSFQESSSVTAGEEVVVASWGGLRWGMSVCYDLRFPELYRRLRVGGAEVLLVPSAFTERTGRDHWEVLLRARAIEEQCYVIAPNQWGRHLPGRDSYGHSMIVDPWGAVIARVGDGEGVAVAEVELSRVAGVRRQIPCLGHARLLG